MYRVRSKFWKRKIRKRLSRKWSMSYKLMVFKFLMFLLVKRYSYKLSVISDRQYLALYTFYTSFVLKVHNLKLAPVLSPIETSKHFYVQLKALKYKLSFIKENINSLLNFEISP